MMSPVDTSLSYGALITIVPDSFISPAPFVSSPEHDDRLEHIPVHLDAEFASHEFHEAPGY